MRQISTNCYHKPVITASGNINAVHLPTRQSTCQNVPEGESLTQEVGEKKNLTSHNPREHSIVKQELVIKSYSQWNQQNNREKAAYSEED